LVLAESSGTTCVSQEQQQAFLFCQEQPQHQHRSGTTTKVFSRKQ